MKITENKIEIGGEMFFCEDFDLKMRIANDTEYMSISEEESENFVFKIVETEIKKEVVVEDEQIEGEEDVEIVEEIEVIEEKGEKVYLVFDEDSKAEKIQSNKLEGLKVRTAEKIYGKYSKETQTTLLYKAFFTFASRILQIDTIKSEFTAEELALLGMAKVVFEDMSQDIAEYEEKKENIINPS